MQAEGLTPYTAGVMRLIAAGIRPDIGVCVGPGSGYRLYKALCELECFIYVRRVGGDGTYVLTNDGKDALSKYREPSR